MAKIEFKPAFFSKQTIIVLSLVIFVDVLLGLLVLPRALALYQQYPQDPSISQFLSVVSGLMIGVPLFGLFIISMVVTSKKIWIDNNLVYFSNKSFIGKWTTVMLNMNDVTSINWREKKVFTGKAVITYAWLVFLHKDSHKQETSVTGWDFPTLKSILLYIKGRYSGIKINTPIYRDSSEELSGLDEFLEKNDSKATSVK